MEIKPVKQYKSPEYPKKDRVHTKILVHTVPKRWGSGAAKIALSALAAISLTACEDYPLAGVPEPPPIKTDIQPSLNTPESSPFKHILDGDIAFHSVTVAPLFIHGEGRGAYGCVMVAPPVFLSEAEALEVINEVAEEFGLSFRDKNTPSFDKVLQPSVRLDSGECGEQSLMKLVADYADAAHGIAIEFVSENDVRNWKNEQLSKSPKPHMEMSAGEYDIRDAAAQLSEALEYADAPDTAVVTGVLYDPCSVSDEAKELALEYNYEDYEQKTRAFSAGQLKLQVRDFFEWLKAQGVI